VEIPSELRYTADHEWVSIKGSVVRVGITDYAQDALGDVVFIQLPVVGAALSAKEGFGEIESTKSVSDVYAPVAGTVVAVNGALASTPELINSDPYGQGWICEIECGEIDEAALLSAEQYRELTGAG
jgi:glycine cleavage system H protein